MFHSSSSSLCGPRNTSKPGTADESAAHNFYRCQLPSTGCPLSFADCYSRSDKPPPPQKKKKQPTIGAENITYIKKIGGNLFDVTRCNTLHHLNCQRYLWCNVFWCCSFGVVMVPLGLTHIHDAGIGDVLPCLCKPENIVTGAQIDANRLHH